MDENSAKPLQTGNSQADALRLALNWLDREGGGQRNARALRELMEATLTAVSRGDPPPEKDTTTLRLLLQHLDGDVMTSGKSLRAAEIETWWDARVEQLRQECIREGCPWLLRLVVKTGGGRNLPSRMSFDFGHIEAQEPEHGDVPKAPDRRLIHYRMDPAKAALWLRLLLGGQSSFPMHSWRGYLVLAVAVLPMVLIGLMWLGQYATWTNGQQINTNVLAQIALAAFVTAGLWWITHPIRSLPSERVTIAGPVFLALSELYGQLRTMRKPEKKFKSREFSVVRHWAICPMCSAEVDLDYGRKAFPDRLVGRCHDAPLEHVFSFDPVRLVGTLLRS